MQKIVVFLLSHTGLKYYKTGSKSIRIKEHLTKQWIDSVILKTQIKKRLSAQIPELKKRKTKRQNK
jgi:hypothetical protein